MSECTQKTTEQRIKDAEEQVTELKKAYKKWKTVVIWIGCTIIAVFLIVAALNAHYIRATESTFSQLQEAINEVSLKATDNVEESRTITVEVNHANLLSADYLAGIIPVIIGLAGALIVFLGMERLKAFDERIDAANSEIGEKLNGFDQKIEQNRNTLRAELTTEAGRSVQSKFVEEREKWTEREKAVSEAQIKSIGELNKQKEVLASELDDEALKHLQELDAKAQEYVDGLNSYTWLKAIINEGETEISVPTVEDAHRLTERLRVQKPAGHIHMIRQVVDKVCNETLSGDKDDYHNFSAELARGNMYNEACRILERGLSFFPYDTDLLADFVEYATKGSMLESAKEKVDKLQNSIPRKLWNWRCYQFISNYYKTVGNIELAYKICDDSIKAIPDDEHGYRSKAELERLMNSGQVGIDNSISVLEEALKRNITCPQCANTLSEILLANGRFEEALEASNRAIRDLAQQQPHITVAFVFYNRANILDRMFLQDAEKAEDRQSLAESACADYIMALSLEQLTMIVANQAKARIQILSSYLPPEVRERVESKLKDVQTKQSIDLLRLIRSIGDDNNDNAVV